MTAEAHSHAVFFGIRVCSRQDAKSAKGKQNDERGRNRRALPYQSFGSGPRLLETLHGDRRMGFVVACRLEEHPSELQSLIRISYAVFCLKNTNNVRHPR